MADLREYITVETRDGEPVTVRGMTVTPRAQVLSVRVPRFGGFVWNRPVGVSVERDGQVERLPVVDVTRWAQAGLGVLAAAVALIMMSRRSS